MPATFFAKLIEDLRGYGHHALADNLQRDLPFEDAPPPCKRVAGCGQNIPKDMAAKVHHESQTRPLPSPSDTNFPWSFQAWMFQLHNDTSTPAFELPENYRNKAPDAVPCIRYISARAFLSQVLGWDNAARKKARYEDLTRAMRKYQEERLIPGMPVSRQEVWLHNIKQMDRIVFVGPDAEAPDRTGQAAGMCGDALACHVIRQLALPGFENQTIRASRGGLVALEFIPRELGTPLYKPTTLDAADNHFFRPAPTNCQHGQTDTLNAELNAVIGVPGCKEWVCRNTAVPLHSAKHTTSWRFVAYFLPPSLA